MQRDSAPHATDIVLRSSDKKLFYSWKIFLSMSSPVFSDMFTLPQPEAPGNVDERYHELPVIDMEEDSCTLGRILSMCHPPSYASKQFEVASVDELRTLLEATKKYQMPENLRRVALEQLSNPSILHDDPVGIYALACQHDYLEAAQSAAKYTLALPTLVRAYMPDLEKIHAGWLCRLLLYREACVTAACSLAEDHTWIVYTDFLPLFRCDIGRGEDLEWTTIKYPPSRKYRSGRREHKSVHKWWLEYMKESKYALQKWPHGDVIKDPKLVDGASTAISASKCDQCKASEVSDAFRSFVLVFAENIERRVAEVEINLGF